MNRSCAARWCGVGLFLATAAITLQGTKGAATPPAQETASIAGVVTDGTTGLPIAGALVSLRRNNRSIDGLPQQETDGKGRYVFLGLPSGSGYSMTAVADGYFAGLYGADISWRGRPIPTVDLAPGQWFSDGRIILNRPASVSGTVFNERGEPVVGVYVRMLDQINVAGMPHLAAGASTVTDDRGMYRIAGLWPGRYVVEVPSVQVSRPASTATSPGPRGSAPEAPLHEGLDVALLLAHYPIPPPPVNGRRWTYPITFAPSGSSLESATAVDLAFGAERTEVDVRLAPVASVSVTGTVRGPGATAVRLLPVGLEDLGAGSEAATATVAQDGTFRFADVPAGTYTLKFSSVLKQFDAAVADSDVTLLMMARSPDRFPPSSPGMQTNATIGGHAVLSAPAGISASVSSAGMTSGSGYWGRAQVTVGDDGVRDVVVEAQPTLSVRGRVEVDPGADTSAAPISLSVTADPADGNAAHLSDVVEKAVDTFTIEGLQPARYFIRLYQSAGWLVKSVATGGRDFGRSAIDVADDQMRDIVLTVTNRAARLAGDVRDRSGAADTEAAVIVWPRDPAEWSGYGLNPPDLGSARTLGDGTFRFDGLPAGDYLVVAVPRASADAWQDPNALRRLAPAATALTLTWGQTANISLRTTP